MSKAALNQLTRHLAVRYGRDGIRANAIAPGFILTETAAAMVPLEIQVRLTEANPARRLGTPDDIARWWSSSAVMPRPTSTGRCSMWTAVTRSPG